MSEDDGLEPDENDEDAPSGFAGLPKETQAELKKLRKENESIRKRLLERDAEVLTVKYGEDIVSMIPEEVTTYERRAELAEVYKAKLAPVTEQSPDQTGTPEPAATSTETEPTGLAAVAKAPAPGTAPGSANADLSATELGKLATDDPAAFSAAIAAKYRT